MIKCSSPDQPIRELSGGNQQKVLLARWLCTNPELLIVDEPTRGIDVGAKREIQTLIGELADEGLAVLLISSELEELIADSTACRAARRPAVAELAGEEISEDAMHAGDGGGSPPSPARHSEGDARWLRHWQPNQAKPDAAPGGAIPTLVAEPRPAVRRRGDCWFCCSSTTRSSPRTS